MRQIITTYKDTPIYFDSDTEQFVCLPQGCTKERKSSALAAMRGEIDAAERRRNQPKRDKTKHYVQWWHRRDECVYSGYFVGARTGKGGTDKGYNFKLDNGTTYINDGYSSDKMLVVPNSTSPEQVEEVKQARKAWLNAKAEYDRLVSEYFVEVRFPYIGWSAEVEDLNQYDADMVARFKKAQEGA